MRRDELENKYRIFLLWLEKKKYLERPVNTKTVIDIYMNILTKKENQTDFMKDDGLGVDRIFTKDCLIKYKSKGDKI